MKASNKSTYQPNISLDVSFPNIKMLDEITPIPSESPYMNQKRKVGFIS